MDFLETNSLDVGHSRGRSEKANAPHDTIGALKAFLNLQQHNPFTFPSPSFTLSFSFLHPFHTFFHAPDRSLIPTFGNKFNPIYLLSAYSIFARFLLSNFSKRTSSWRIVTLIGTLEFRLFVREVYMQSMAMIEMS